MIYNLQNENESQNAKQRFEYFLKSGKTIDLLEKKNTRSSQQNKALHMLFTIISSQLNEMGIDFQYVGLKGMELSMRHTPDLVKNFIWRPIQIALFDIKSTTKINTKQINEIVDVLTKFFAEKGVVIQFPSKDQIDKLINN
jgi:membrane protease subunit (stomatin/prohibitin family)